MFSSSYMDTSSFAFHADFHEKPKGWRIKAAPTFEEQQKAVLASIDTYTSFWKLSLFGHHHNNRASQLAKQIKSCANMDSIKNLLLQQQSLFASENTSVSSSIWKCLRFTSREEVKNGSKKVDVKKSGFLKMLQTTLNIIESFKPINQPLEPFYHY